MLNKADLPTLGTKMGAYRTAMHVLVFIGAALVVTFMLGMVVYGSDAQELVDRVTDAAEMVQEHIVTASTALGAVFLAIAFLLKMFSKNQRTVDECNQWIKRIAIALACIHVVNLLVYFIRNVAQGE